MASPEARFYIVAGDRDEGPYTRAQLEVSLVERVLAPASLVRAEGADDARPLSEVLRAAASVPPPARSSLGVRRRRAPTKQGVEDDYAPARATTSDEAWATNAGGAGEPERRRVRRAIVLVLVVSWTAVILMPLSATAFTVARDRLLTWLADQSPSGCAWCGDARHLLELDGARTQIHGKWALYDVLTCVALVRLAAAATTLLRAADRWRLRAAGVALIAACMVEVVWSTVVMAAIGVVVTCAATTVTLLAAAQIARRHGRRRTAWAAVALAVTDPVPTALLMMGGLGPALSAIVTGLAVVANLSKTALLLIVHRALRLPRGDASARAAGG